MNITQNDVLDQLKRVGLPDGGNIVSRDMVRAVTVGDGRVSFVLEVPEQLGARMEPVRTAAESLLREMPGVNHASVVMTSHTAREPTSTRRGPPPDLKIGRHPSPGSEPEAVKGVRKLVAVASGKGGVGKSTVAVNLAVAMAKLGKRTGLLDADIHGPSIPMMMGTNSRPSSPDGKNIIPLVAHGIKFMSIGLLLPEEEPVIWRGPMLMGALQQMLQQVTWGDLDVLVVDLPPGTGDVQLTLCQKFQLDGAVVVCTPQDVALLDARRAISMFRKLNSPVLGIIENMAYFACPDCGERSYIFGKGGARREARKLGVPFLGEIPLNIDIRESGDEGMPVAAGKGEVASAFALIGELVT